MAGLAFRVGPISLTTNNVLIPTIIIGTRGATDWEKILLNMYLRTYCQNLQGTLNNSIIRQPNLKMGKRFE